MIPRRMIRFLLAIALTLLAPGFASASDIAALAWMSGSWGGVQNGVRSEEHWSTPDGGLMTCMHKDVREGRTRFFEFLRIVQRGDSLVFIALPKGRGETEFPMKEIAERRIVFENTAHDFPQRVIYWSDRKGTLSARVEGIVNGKEEFQEWTWQRTRLAP